MPLKPPRRPEGKPPRIRVAGHMGELVQGRLGAQGPVALITLPCPVLAAIVSRRPGPFHLHQPGAPVLRPEQAADLLRRLDLPVAGHFTLRSTLPPGGGAGASTAALVALARAAGAAEDRIAPACLAVEGASDPLMFAAPGRLLWASRRAMVLDRLPALPRLEVLAGFFGPPRRTDPRDEDFPDVSDLLAAWPAACADAAALAALASASARRTLGLRGPAGDPTERLAQDLGAAGFAIGHTGPARALLFLPGTMPEAAAAQLQAAGFRTILRYAIGDRDA